MNLSNTVNYFASPLTYRTYAAGSYDASGNWTKGTASESTITMMVVPATGRELKDVPEGIREEVLYAGYTSSTITKDSEVDYNSETFRVIYIFPWLVGAFHKVMLGKVK